MRRVTKLLAFVMLAITLALATWSVRALAEEPAPAPEEQVETVSAAPEEEAEAPTEAPEPEPASTPATQPAATTPATTTTDAPHAAADGASPTTINQLMVKWNDTARVDANGILQLKPVSNNFNDYGNPGNSPMVASAELYFDISGSEVHAPGTVELRIPAHVFPHRNGGAADTLEIGVPQYQDPMPAGNENEFAWKLDNHGTSDPMDDELVLVNVLELSPASQYSCTVVYTVVHPSTVKDETTTRAFYADMKIEEADTITKDSNRIEAFVDTESNPNAADKEAYTVYDSWQSSWGARPAGYQDGDIYVVFWVREWMWAQDSQPFTITFMDTPLDHGGEVVGYSDISVGTTTQITSARMTPPATFHTNPPTRTIMTPSRAQNGSNATYAQACFVLVRYPKDQINASGTTPLRNQVTATLTGIDDQIPKTRTATITYNYRRVEFTAPPGNYNGSKGRGGTIRGGIEMLLAGKTVEGYDGSNHGFSNSCRSDGYVLTLREGGDPKNPADYGQRPYTVELVDDTVFFEDDNHAMELGPDDYQFTFILFQSTGLSLYEWVPNTAQGRYVSQQVTSGTFPDVVYYGQFGTNDWVKLGTAHFGSNGRFSSFTVADSRASYRHDYTFGGERINLASGCTAVKATVTTTAYRVDFSYQAMVAVKPSERVVSYLQQQVDENPDTNLSVRFTNVNTHLVYDADGRLQNVGYDYTGSWADRIEARDAARYGTAPGRTVGHWAGDLTLTSYTRSSGTYKTGTATNDPAHKRVIIQYRMYAYEEMGRSPSTNVSEILEDGLFVPQTGGTFYDLLPVGMEPDLSTVQVGWHGNITNNDVMPDTRRYIITDKHVEEDWRGTGRTLLVVSWEMNPSYSAYGPYTVYTSSLQSNAYLWFTAYYPWEAAEDYGLNPLNSFAYETANDSITRGNPDDGGTNITERNLLVDMNDDGNPEDTPSTFLYGQCNVDVSGVFSAYASLEKHVRLGRSGAWDMGLTNELRTHADGTYQYRLRYVTATATTSRNIVFYDALESYKPDEKAPERDQNAETWQGTFVGLDLSQPRMRGVNPVVYYSTIEDLDIEHNQDLTNTDVWVRADDYEGDLAEVRAIAVDCSKKTDGTDFVLPEKQSLVVLVNMRAPKDAHEANALAVENAAAFNQDWVSGKLGSTSGHESEQGIIHTEYTRVLLTPVNVDIPVEKVWEDDNDRDGLRPDSVTVRLLADGEPVLDAEGNELTLELNEENDWQGTFEDLPEYVYQEPEDPEGEGSWHKVEYTLEEIDVPEGYEFECSGDSLGLTATNTHKPQTTSISVVKVWQDGEDEDGIRPQSVSVRLLADGEPVLDAEGNEVVLELTADGGWDGSFDELPVYRDGGEEIVYTVEEIEVAEGYEATVEGTPEDGFTITNTHEPVHEGGDSGDDNPPDDKPDDGPKPDTPGDNGKDEPGGSSSKQDSKPRILPRTMDDLIDALPLLGVGAAVLLAGILLRRRKS